MALLRQIGVGVFVKNCLTASVRFRLQPCRGLIVERSGAPESAALIREQWHCIIGDMAPSTGSTLLPLDLPPWPNRQSSLTPKHMSDSYCESLVELSDPRLSLLYKNVHNGVRVGKLLEDLDILAVEIAYKHNNQSAKSGLLPMVLVTGRVERIVVKAEDVDPNKDILLRGHVIWAGISSLAVLITVEQENGSCWNHLFDSTFWMVARDPIKGRKSVVCPLRIDTEEEKKLFMQGETCKLYREKEAARSLLRVPPDEEERLIMHNLFLETLNKKEASFKFPIKPKGSEWIEDTRLQNTFLCFPKQSNVYNKMFGGFLMRTALEFASATAWIHCREPVTIAGIDEIVFQRSVDIGSLGKISSQVVYTDDNKMQIRVHVKVMDETNHDFVFTDIIYLVYKSKSAVPKVYPKTYGEYMMYIDGRRHYECFLQDSPKL